MDVVLPCDGLYSMTENDRMKFFESCINSWLKPETGRIVVLSSFEDDEMARLRQQFKKQLLTMEFLNGAMKSIGWKYKFEMWYESKIDSSDLRKKFYVSRRYRRSLH